MVTFRIPKRFVGTGEHGPNPTKESTKLSATVHVGLEAEV